MNPARFAAHGIGPTTVSGSMSILLANAIQLMDVVMSGILPRNPAPTRLRGERDRLAALREGGPRPRLRLRERPDREARVHEATPSEYLREQVWACTFFEEFAANNFLDEIGSDRVLFETD